MIIGRSGFGGDADSGSGGGTDRGGGGYGWYGDRISRWGDNVAPITLGMEHNDPLAYYPGLELHHPITSTLGDTRGRLKREIAHL